MFKKLITFHNVNFSEVVLERHPAGKSLPCPDLSLLISGILYSPKDNSVVKIILKYHTKSRLQEHSW